MGVKDPANPTLRPHWGWVLTDDEKEELAADPAFSGTYATLGGLRAIAIGDSITAGTGGGNQTSWFGQACLKSAGRLVLQRNAGVAGEVSSQMLARFAADVTAYSPHVVFIMSGSNDMNAGGYSRSATVANVEGMVVAARAAGARVVLLGIPPNAVGRAKVAALNNAYRNLAARYRIPYVDAYTPLVDPATGTFLAGYSGDGTHPTHPAHGLIADNVLAAIPDLLRGQAFLPGENADSASLITNGLFLTDGNADGIADNWSSAGGGAGLTPSLVTGDTTIKGNWQRITMSGSTTFQTIFQSVSTGFAVGDQMLLCARVRAASVAGTGRFSIFGGGQAFTAFAMQDLQANISGVLQHEFTVPAGTTSMNIGFQAKAVTTSGDITVDLAQVGLYNLTANGGL